ncbi:MAG: BatD family protein [Bacteroidota bacterium]
MKKYGILFSFLLSSFSVFAQQDIKFYAVAHVEKAAVSEPFQVTFVIEGTDFENFEMPELTDFEYAGPPSQSSNISIINGNMTKSFKYTYYLKADAEGEFELGSATIQVQEEEISSAPIMIKVGKTAILKEGIEEEEVPFFRKDRKRKKKKPATIKV